jgi:acyl transferase domain-containing protein
VKSNLGHTQAAAGAAGLIKMVLALRHQMLPATLHAAEPSPFVDWDGGSVRLLTEPADWPADGRPRRAGVSAFGISGTNAHVILEEPPAGPGVPEPPRTARPVLAEGPLAWLLSGRTPAALAAQAGRLAAWVTARPELDAADIGWSLAATRPAFGHRAVVTGTDREELVAGLTAAAAGQSRAGLVTGAEAESPGRVAFLFAGQGSQRAGMGAQLHAASPVFAAAFDEACARLEAELGVPLAEVVLGSDEGGRADQTLYAQPGLFAMGAGLVALLAACGITPDAVAGHSVGEITAAYAAGVLSLPDACRLVAARARLMQALPDGGAMTAIAAAEHEVTAALAGLSGVCVAAVNGPASVVISGESGPVADLAQQFLARGRRVRRLRVSHAFHSARMDPVLAELGQVAAGLDHAPPRVPWAAGLTGELVTAPGPEYWARQAREPVRYAAAVAALAAQDVSVFLEIGPDGTLSALGPAALPEDGDGTPGGGADDGGGAVFIPVLRPGQAAPAALVAALAGAHVRGAPVNWNAILTGKRAELPTYAFQRQRYWPGPRPCGTARRDEQHGQAEARFWAAVEDGDLQALADTMDAGTERASLARVLPALASWRRRERGETAIAGCRYGVTWTPVADPGAVTLAGSWLLVVPEATAALASGCQRALTAQGAQVTVLAAGPALDRQELAARIGQAQHTPLAGVVSLLGLEEAPQPGEPAAATGLAGTMLLVQALGDAGIAAPLWVITRGAVGTGPAGQLTSPVQAQIWGLGLVAGLEHPDRWGGLIDLPSALDDRTGAWLAAVLAGCGEDQVAIRASGILARRLTRVPPPGGRPWRPRGTALVTGGTGAIGGHVARWLATEGIPRVALAGRSGPAAPGAAALTAGLAASGTAVTVLACNFAERSAVSALLARLSASGPPLTAVMHAAGTGQATPLADSTVAELAAVLSAKALGARWLDELTTGLEQFVLFSSVSATWGSGQQPAYAAANAYLDGLAQHRRASGRPATAVAWGQWGGGGMAAGDSAAQFEQRGLRKMDPDLAIRALGQALAGAETSVSIADIDWSRFVPAYTLARPSPLIADLPDVRQVLAAAEAAEREAVASGARSALEQRLANVPPAEQARIILELIRTEAAAVLGLAAAETVRPGRPFRELGFDSLTAVELRGRLTAVTGLRLPATLVFDYPTPADLSGYLAAELRQDEAAATETVFARLDQLETSLAVLAADSDIRADVAARLRTVLSGLTGGHDPEQAGVTSRLQSASADEVLRFISNELGVR